MTTIARAPQHNTAFTIVTQQYIEYNGNPFCIEFYGYTTSDAHKHQDKSAYYIGCLVGYPFDDNEFCKKLERIRAIFKLRGVSTTEAWGRLGLSKAKRLDNIQKYNKKVSRITNEYNRQRRAAEGTLYSSDRIAELDKGYAAAINKAKSIYNITD